MSDETKLTEEKECKCFCHSKGFRKFLTIALGTFVGVYAALCLFTAMHRPPVMPFGYGFKGVPPIAMPCPCHQHKHHFDRGSNKGDFQKAIKEHKGPAPFEKDRSLDND